MSRWPRDHPKRLASKLREIRVGLHLTQEQMAMRLQQTKASTQPGHISEFERGRREPSLSVLLHYARMAGVPVDALIDDEIDLPNVFRQEGGKEKKAVGRQKR